MTERSHIRPEHDVRPYSVAQLADRWGCSGNVVRKLINQGELAYFRIGTLIRIAAAEVARFEATPVEERKAAPDKQDAPQAIASPKRVIPRAPRRREPIVIDRSKVLPPPSKRAPKADP